MRQELSTPVLADLNNWRQAERAKLSRHSSVAKAMDYTGSTLTGAVQALVVAPCAGRGVVVDGDVVARLAVVEPAGPGGDAQGLTCMASSVRFMGLSCRANGRSTGERSGCRRAFAGRRRGWVPAPRSRARARRRRGNE